MEVRAPHARDRTWLVFNHHDLILSASIRGEKEKIFVISSKMMKDTWYSDLTSLNSKVELVSATAGPV